jgi:hypothetical protein
VDPYGDVCLDFDEVPSLIAEIDFLLDEARPGPEYRGLMRLRAMAVRCGQERGRLVFVGD